MYRLMQDIILCINDVHQCAADVQKIGLLIVMHICIMGESHSSKSLVRIIVQSHKPT
jgi:hypothetical protein